MSTLNEIVARVFEIQASEVTDELSRDTLEEWDSFNHLLLISEIEKELNIKFTIPEVEQIKTIGLLKNTLEKKACLK